MRLGSPRIVVKAMGASRGPGAVVGVIEDAKNVGASDYANEPGELFFTLPITHPLASSISPLQQHYELYRYGAAATWDAQAVQPEGYRLVASGLIDDYEVTKDEMVVYGTDYKGLLETTISSSNTSYTNTQIGTIIANQITAGRAEANSRYAWMSATVAVSGATQTTTVITSYQPRLHFIADLANILMSNTSVRSLLFYEPDLQKWSFQGNQLDDSGVSAGTPLLLYGGNVTDYRYWTGKSDFATRIFGIGIKRAGAAVLYSTQTYASESTYGWIARPSLHRDIINQTALDNIVKRDAREAGDNAAELAVQIAQNPNDLDPIQVPQESAESGWHYGNLWVGHRVHAVVNRGFLALDADYTIWGWEWVVRPDGMEDLYFSLTPRRT